MSYSPTLRGSYSQFDPDVAAGETVALRVNLSCVEDEQPVHHHRKGQLVLALRGSVTCRLSDALMMVLPQSGVWIPSELPHSNQASPDSQIIFLFVEPDALALPARPCILSISPLIREMVIHLADHGDTFSEQVHRAQFCQVLLHQLSGSPVEQLSLPISTHPKLRNVCNALIDNPADRRSRAEWASMVAMSERTFDRLVMKETGQSFGRWRQQLQLVVALRDLSGGASVQQVALALGYESTTAFIIMFKKAFGVPPGQYMLDRRAHVAADPVEESV
ncbi:helix-turn-helix transcriptional regulator [Paraburkholderia sp. SEWSISQ10-3 4]|uniref:AraC family transcriptional regulator n=1 Tax=Paraburkholderia TaxID=1822464 RepID=UPI00190925F3|nr:MULTISPECIES: helix-turn-helix transcriptional regulator [Paraburkholderia]MBK3840001.1 helix-turn-helix transcriptional regulator [Paraburkholderia aspalathi]MCX4140276.1 helix-turn-helix transcriptional regulator [Paraburkholderia aspalathi]MDN7172963.1 helix-turn-helix transcriptional regulator [Paraburkholderia sp. SEWSISQ10-3 4]MDQ6502602.1 helix-turn-helix transcriptional regulator [Paraburkholderia aspalathi]CAE6772626.1 HTH-type transcriptional regulator NimR [Paraburkholderia aspal